MRYVARLAAVLLPLAGVAAVFFLYVGLYAVVPLVVAIAIALLIGGRRDSNALETVVAAAFAAATLAVGGLILVWLVYEGR